MSTATHTRVFVYGTLRRGECNHEVLRGARFVGAARTEPRYRLVDLGAFPAMLAGGTTAVAGEVYEVDGATLAALDRLEGTPRFYERAVVVLEGGTEVQAYLLRAGSRGPVRLIASGDWRSHRRNGGTCNDHRDA